jgi:SulP family sulfate permease
MRGIFSPKLFTLIAAGVSRQQIAQDILAGIVVGIVALPLGIAFAVASGVSPEKGLITAVVAGFLISLLGGSRVQIGGPTGAFIVIVYGIIEQYGLHGLMISTILAGVILIIFGLLRMGALLKYFPHPLIVGFTSGIAVVIFSTQVKDALGLPLDHVPSGFLAKWGVYIAHRGELNWYAVAVTAVTICITVGAPRVMTKIPGSFIAIIIATVAVQVCGIPVTTIESFFGDIPRTIHVVAPQFSLGDISTYMVPALTIALLGGIESLLSAVVADGMIGGNHRSNTELIAQGIANIITPFFGGIPATGAIARTATNVKNGGRTPFAGIAHALTVLAIMLFFGQWAKLIPMSCLAGILMVISYNMSEWRLFRSILKSSYFDVLTLLVTFLLTVLVDLTVAIEVGVVLSALLFMKRMGDVSKSFPAELDSDLLDDYSNLESAISIYEISGPFFFASAKQYVSVLKEIGAKSSILVIRMRHVPFIDATGIHNFKDMVDMLRAAEVCIILSGINKEVHRSLQKAGLIERIGEEFICDTFDVAVARARKLHADAGENRSMTL